MDKKYFKSKQNVRLGDVFIGDLHYLDDADAAKFLYQESLNRACTVELVIEEKPVTCPEW